MLAAGEDARFIARRLVILASEDVGMADPMALLVADAAAGRSSSSACPRPPQSGPSRHPSGQRPQVQPRHHLLGAAQADVADQPAGQVPPHLRDAHYRGAARLGHGKGYQYPHDDDRGWVKQEYRPRHLEGRPYYEPSSHGDEPDRVAVGSAIRGYGGG
jgi:putative ATPase